MLLARLRDWLAGCFRGGLFWRFAMWCWAAFKNGFFYRFAVGGEKADSLWRGSLCYRALSWLIDLPARIARAVCSAGAVQSSFLAGQTLDFAVRRAALFCGAAAMLMLVIPQEMWDNKYSLALGLCACALTVLSRAASGGRSALREIGFFPVLFALCTFLGLVLSTRPDMSLRFFVFGVTCMLFVLAVAGAPRSPRELGNIVFLASLGMFVCSCWAIVQRLIGVESNGILTDLSLNADMPGRVYSFFENPNSFANVLVLFLPIMLTMALFEKGGLKKLWYLAVFAAGAAALLMTYARGGWLSIAASLGVMLLALGPRWTPLCVTGAAAAVPFLPDNILNRILSMFAGGDSSIYTRTYIYTAMRRLIENHPLFGVGLGADAVRNAVYAEHVYDAEALFTHGHNIYLQIWAEMGVFALIAFVCAMAFAVRAGLQLRSDSDATLRAVGVGAACALCGSMVFGLTDYAWSYPRVMVLFWFVFALIPAAVRLKNIREAR